MRLKSFLKFNRLSNNKRVPYHIKHADVHLNQYASIEATGAMIDPQAGKIYWMEFQATADSATAEINDAIGSAINKRLGGKYFAKDSDSFVLYFDPPKPFNSGFYATISNMIVDICYQAYGRVLPCKVTVAYAPGITNLVSRVTVLLESSNNLVSRLTVLKEASSNLVSRLTTRVESSSNLVSQATVLNESSNDLVSRVSVVFASTSLDLVSRVTVLNESSDDLVSRVTVIYAAQVRYLVCRLTVIGKSLKNLTCRVTVTS